MLKSTYTPSPNAPPPLPDGWTEHKAPTGHMYYYNASTKESTYTRPVAAPARPPPSGLSAPFHSPIGPVPPQAGSLADPQAANAFMQAYNPEFLAHQAAERERREKERQERLNRPRAQPIDKPRRKVAIPGCEPWLLVYTKYGRRFAYNPDKNASYWRIPDKLKAGILELDIGHVTIKAGKEEGAKDAKSTPGTDVPGNEGDESEEYEEIEVTDSEGEGDGEGGHRSKRQRTEDPAEDTGPVEFSEADMMMQLQAMGEDYSMDPGEYDDGSEGGDADGYELSEEDSKNLFKDLLDDFKINPYSPWDKLIEEGKVFDDPRYTALSTMKARRDAWEEWSRERIKSLKEARAREAKKDPRIAYLSLLQEKATPKLYWPEFKRKFKMEEAMRDTKLADKDREKMYREYISRLKMPQSKLKQELTALLKAQPLKMLNNSSLVSSLPSEILADMRYITLDTATRDPLIEAYIQTLPPPPEDGEQAEADEVTTKARQDRKRRENALREREQAIAEQKRREERNIRAGRAILKQEEREVQAAMNIGRKGLMGQLKAAQEESRTHQ